MTASNDNVKGRASEGLMRGGLAAKHDVTPPMAIKIIRLMRSLRCVPHTFAVEENMGMRRNRDEP